MSNCTETQATTCHRMPLLTPSGFGLAEGQTSLSSTATAIAYLVHQDNTTENGFVFEFGRGKAASFHRQRARGLLLRADATLTPGSILQRWHEVSDFGLPEYPSGPNKFLELQKEGLKLPPNDKGVPISFQGTTVLVTGGGSGYVLFAVPYYPPCRWEQVF